MHAGAVWCVSVCVCEWRLYRVSVCPSVHVGSRCAVCLAAAVRLHTVSPLAVHLSTSRVSIGVSLLYRNQHTHTHILVLLCCVVLCCVFWSAFHSATAPICPMHL